MGLCCLKHLYGMGCALEVGVSVRSRGRPGVPGTRVGGTQMFASDPLCPWFPDAISATNPRVIDDSRARKLSNDLKRCTYYETCATYGLNVERVFQDGNCSGRRVSGPGGQQCCPARRRTVSVPSSQLGRSVAARQNKSGTRSLAVQLLYSHRQVLGVQLAACV